MCLRGSRRLLIRIREWRAEQLLQERQPGADRSAEEAVIADLDKGMGEDMLQKTLKELLDGKRVRAWELGVDPRTVDAKRYGELLDRAGEEILSVFVMESLVTIPIKWPRLEA